MIDRNVASLLVDGYNAYIPCAAAISQLRRAGGRVGAASAAAPVTRAPNHAAPPQASFEKNSLVAAILGCLSPPIQARCTGAKAGLATGAEPGRDGPLG